AVHARSSSSPAACRLRFAPLPLSFQRYVDLRDLHSFPTRRSSDLASTRRASTLRRRSGSGRPRSWSSGRPGRRSSPGSRRTRVLDRKSTRLNSSHVKISYAVFCLKKKKSSECQVQALTEGDDGSGG